MRAMTAANQIIEDFVATEYKVWIRHGRRE